ncbi:hypothetical protein [Synechococcus phage S-H9-2]|jgi:nucleotidyltransferase/DNA polymerase involved in DNA repair|uniref:Uncharacterized protein n=1 Tax=Synechococcus phage S-H9-2 TaxID=2783669 RepID=A0A873WG13_9CAUD|nr:hypothetical protein PQC10_gp059 [Synechococcus phage S-H9-2]QPB08336.1 hypothetical protein [Synechococcus phage S-H9-2]
MSRVSTLSNVYNNFNVDNRFQTYKKIVTKALQAQSSSSSRRKSTRLTGIRSIVREQFPLLTEKQVIQAQDNVSEWFDNNKNSVDFAHYRSQLPYIFNKQQPQQKLETPVTPVVSEVSTMEDCIQAIMSKSQAKIKWSQGDQILEAEWSN